MQKGQALIFLLLGILLLVGVASGTYYLGRQTTSKPPPASVVTTPIPQTTPTPSLTSASNNETANWKTYTGELYSFKYPSDYKPTEDTTNDTYVVKIDFKSSSDTPPFSFEIRKASTLADEVTYRKWQINGHQNNSVDEGKPVSIAGINGQILTVTNGSSTDKQSIVIFLKNQYAYTLTVNSSLAEQVLSTFKFTN